MKKYIKLSDKLLKIVNEKMNELDLDFQSFVEYSILKANEIYLTDLVSEDKNIEDENLFNNYVYIYLNPLKKGNYKYKEYLFEYEPIYVGKGNYNRDISHINNSHNSQLNNFLIELKSNNIEPIIIKIKENISNYEAYYLEGLLIHLIGRLDLNLGPLFNITGGGKFNLPTTSSSNYIEYKLNVHFIEVLNKSKTIKEAAFILGISERTIYRKIKILNLQKVNKKYVVKDTLNNEKK